MPKMEIRSRVRSWPSALRTRQESYAEAGKPRGRVFSPLDLERAHGHSSADTPQPSPAQHSSEAANAHTIPNRSTRSLHTLSPISIHPSSIFFLTSPQTLDKIILASSFLNTHDTSSVTIKRTERVTQLRQPITTGTWLRARPFASTLDGRPFDTTSRPNIRTFCCYHHPA